MWYGVFLWALVSSLAFHVPAALLALFTLRHHKYGRFMSVSVLLMGIVGPITAGTLTSTASARRHRPGALWGSEIALGNSGVPRDGDYPSAFVSPCPAFERVEPYPAVEPCIRHTKRAHGCRAKGLSHF